MTSVAATVMPGASALTGSVVEAPYTAGPSAGAVTVTGPSAPAVSGAAAPVAHSGVRVGPGVPVRTVTVLSASALLLTTRCSTRSSRSTRAKAGTPGPSAAKRGSWAP